MDGTPASKAGLQRGDRIVKIEDESTLNMPLNGAVDRLRGARGTKVTIYIRRKNQVVSARVTEPCFHDAEGRLLRS